jgi:uncharacterized protein YcsI (UPF0317 family)
MTSIGLAGLSTGQLVRLAVRDGRFNGSTAGVAAGYVQANVTIVPAAYARDFRAFCEANPKPCPVLAVGEPGSPFLPTVGQDLDLRTDVPRYLVFEQGVESAKVSNLMSVWTGDLVAFALGCSYSFDHLLVAAGVPLRHLSRHSNVAMWRTAIQTTPIGAFRGPLVVSMRPIKQRDLGRTLQITESLQTVHGAPIHWGSAAPLGIADLSRPDYGDPMPLEPGEIPVFWACGVTAQAAIQHARLPFAITHSPGCMLVTDLKLGALGREGA